MLDLDAQQIQVQQRSVWVRRSSVRLLEHVAVYLSMLYFFHSAFLQSLLMFYTGLYLGSHSSIIRQCYVSADTRSKVDQHLLVEEKGSRECGGVLIATTRIPRKIAFASHREWPDGLL